MRIGSLQKLTLIDYPGKVGATIFAQGCNFACPYCHNPELVASFPDQPFLSEDDVFSFLEKRKGKLEAVTITGGEPTLQKNLHSFAKNIKAMGYLLKMDTNGSHPEILERLINSGLLDYVAMDVKAPLNKYAGVTRSPVSIEAIRRSIKIILASEISTEFRTTVVRSQLAPEDLLEIGKLIANAPLYALQRFVPSKPLDVAFLQEKTFSEDEFATVKQVLEKNIATVLIR